MYLLYSSYYKTKACLFLLNVVDDSGGSDDRGRGLRRAAQGGPVLGGKGGQGRGVLGGRGVVGPRSAVLPQLVPRRSRGGGFGGGGAGGSW